MGCAPFAAQGAESCRELTTGFQPAALERERVTSLLPSCEREIMPVPVRAGSAFVPEPNLRVPVRLASASATFASAAVATSTNLAAPPGSRISA